MHHTISVLVVNQSGVLSRISGLFSGRGFNIESLNVAETNDSGISRMTIVTHGDHKKMYQRIEKTSIKLVCKQSNSENQIIKWVQNAYKKVKVIINPEKVHITLTKS